MTVSIGALAAHPIALVEDIRVLRDGIVSILREQGLRVVAAVRSGEDTLQRILGAGARLVLLDAALGNNGGPRLARAVTDANPEVKVVVMDMRPAQSDVVDFVRAGVSGFILRDASADEIVATLKSVASGLAVLPPKLAGVLFSHVAAQSATARSAIDAVRRLTPRENQIIALIGDSATNKEIAQRLNIAVHTVKSHVHSVLEKLSLTSRVQIASYAHFAAPSTYMPTAELIPRI